MNLREENEYLRERVAQLEAALKGDESDIPREWGLTEMQRKLVAILKARSPEPVSYDAILLGLYGDRPRMTGLDTVKTMVSFIREKLIGQGWRIQTYWAFGYALIEGEDEDAPIPRVPFRRWTSVDDRLLRQSVSIRDAMAATGRTWSAVARRAHNIGHRWRRAA